MLEIDEWDFHKLEPYKYMKRNGKYVWDNDIYVMIAENLSMI